MGESKRRRAEIEQIKKQSDEWIAGLPHIEQEIARIAMRAHERIVEQRGLIAGCYLLAFFLTDFLREEKGITVTPVVGWVNDGTDLVKASHAWIEYEGRKTDIALTRTERSDFQPTGDLLVLDRVIRKGMTQYSYHRERSAEDIAFNIKLGEEHLELKFALEAKEIEHNRMVVVARNPQLMRGFMNGAPKDRNYAALAGMIR